MPYVDPINWTPGQVVTAANLNEQVSENMRSLHERTIGAAAAQHVALPLTGLTVANDTNTTVHIGANADLEITTTGGDIMVSISMSVSRGLSDFIFVDVRVDNGSWMPAINLPQDVRTNRTPATGVFIFANIAAGTHTISFGIRNTTVQEIFLLDAREIVGAA